MKRVISTFLNDETGISISVVIVVIGAVAWISSLRAETTELAVRVDKIDVSVSEDLKEIRRDLKEILERLIRVEPRR